ncbi:hypothetical protein [Chloroflexus sp.]|uniref:hypothetical protein n=1 Tax=Chloroflexus sp. TaxID=1904827 RepID=UPI002586816F|nr:hypothetical protein [Chloroflexus sp.]
MKRANEWAKLMRQPVSPIDALTDGFATIHRQPFILLFSIGLSAYVWLGSAITLALPPYTDQGLIGSFLGTLHAIDARTFLVPTNLIPILTPGVETIIPPPLVLSVEQYILALIGLNLVALVVSSVFLASLYRLMLMRPRPVAQPTLFHHSLAIAVRLAGVLGLIGSVVVPLLICSVVIIWLMPTTFSLVYTVWIGLGLVGLVVFGFAPEIIVFHNYGPLMALQASWRFARQRWFSIATFLALCVIIEIGFAGLWRAVAAQPGWLAPAIVGQAYIGSGLRTARLQFYRRYADVTVS